MAEFFIGTEISYLNRLSQFDVSLRAADLYNGSTAGNSEVLWALITRLNTDRDEKIKNKVVDALLRLHGNWAAISNLRST